MILVMLSLLAGATEVHVVRRGETAESIAESLGDADLVKELREVNGLGRRDQPAPGAMLELPPGLEGSSCQPSYVLRLAGEGHITRPDGTMLPLAVHEPLPNGSVVCVAEASFATVRLSADLEERTHDDVLLMPGTCVRVRTAVVRQGRRSTMLELSAGELSVAGGAGGGEVVVRTGSGVAVSEAGGFRVSVESEAMRTEALSSEVLTMGAGAQVDVPAGFGNRILTGEQPGSPVELPPAGTLLTPGDDQQLRRPSFTWTPADRAVRYLVEMSTSPDFLDLVRREPVGPVEWDPEMLFLPHKTGEMWWRVISFDRTGFGGLPSDSRRFFFPSAMGAP